MWIVESYRTLASRMFRRGVLLALLLAPCAALALQYGTYRCWHYNVTGGVGNCRLAPPIVIKADGTDLQRIFNGRHLSRHGRGHPFLCLEYSRSRASSSQKSDHLRIRLSGLAPHGDVLVPALYGSRGHGPGFHAG